jgi:hypothetical protein
VFAGAAGSLVTLPSAIAGSSATPRLLVLPWLVVDRTTNRECSRAAEPALGDEARRLSRSAGEALDSGLHRVGKASLISASEWRAPWAALRPHQVYRLGEGCAICTAPSELLRFEAGALLGLAQSVRADYVWLGLTVVPLSTESKANRPDDCCKDALGRGRSRVLARSSAVLVRVADGAVVWQRDARRFEDDIPARVGKVSRSRRTRVAMAVDGTAHRLAEAFNREHREALR